MPRDRSGTAPLQFYYKFPDPLDFFPGMLYHISTAETDQADGMEGGTQNMDDFDRIFSDRR